MGTVYQLVPMKPGGVPLALKTFHEPADRSQFIREAEVWSSLGTHRHIAHAFACSELHGKPAILADWYDKSLAETDIKAWPSPNIAEFFLQLIEGLRYAYERAGVVHQDVKPSNVLIDIRNAPRLTDFGMARFSRENLTGVGNIKDVRTTMRDSVSLGPIGGTPIYMAPELFLGESPSVRTDIFSLGVTLYQTLTGKFPFIGPETGYRFRPVLRNTPLQAFINQRGVKVKPLISVILSALELDPKSRPGTYADLLSAASLRDTARPQAGPETVDDIVAQAAFLRGQSRCEQALELLRRSLQDRPTNPVLLNSYAVLLLSQQRQEEANNIFRMAVESLHASSGLYQGKLYLDPLVNLAAQMISSRQFGQANRLLRLAWGWSTIDPRDFLHDFPEFGWWFLYCGKFDEGCGHILESYKYRAPDEASLLWLTLAAWLSGTFPRLANTLARHYMALDRMGIQTALCACIVANALPVDPGNNLVQKAYRDNEADLREAAKELGLNPPTFKPPLPMTACKTVIRSLDAMTTGGKYRDAIG
jgi:serine/threonine protein kinase